MKFLVTDTVGTSGSVVWDTAQGDLRDLIEHWYPLDDATQEQALAIDEALDDAGRTYSTVADGARNYLGITVEAVDDDGEE